MCLNVLKVIDLNKNVNVLIKNENDLNENGGNDLNEVIIVYFDLIDKKLNHFDLKIDFELELIENNEFLLVLESDIMNFPYPCF